MLHRAHIGNIHIFPKHETKTAVPLSSSTSMLAPKDVTLLNSRKEKATAITACPRHGTAPTNGTGSSVSQAGGQRATRGSRTLPLNPTKYPRAGEGP